MPNPGGYGTGSVPPEIAFTAGPGKKITISASGTWSCGLGSAGPAGGSCGSYPNVNILPFGGIGGFQGRQLSLIGIFLDAANPPNVVSGNGIGLPFLVGTGGTFDVPASATRLILGMGDECTGGGGGETASCYGDNGGSVSVAYTIVGGSPRLTLISGDKQTGSPAASLPQALTIAVSNSQNQLLSNVPIGFSVTRRPSESADDGALAPAATTTNSQGVASTVYTLGTSTGNYEVTATCSICSPQSLTFTATAIKQFNITFKAFIPPETVSVLLPFGAQYCTPQSGRFAGVPLNIRDSGNGRSFDRTSSSYKLHGAITLSVGNIAQNSDGYILSSKLLDAGISAAWAGDAFRSVLFADDPTRQPDLYDDSAQFLNPLVQSALNDYRRTISYRFDAAGFPLDKTFRVDCRGLAQVLKAVVTPTNMRLSVVYLSENTVTLRLSGAVGNPLLPGSSTIGPIAFDLSLSIDTRTSNVTYSVSGSHTCYPAFELYIDDKTVFATSPEGNSGRRIANCLMGNLPARQYNCTQNKVGTTCQAQ
jgi:hypothetical protein